MSANLFKQHVSVVSNIGQWIFCFNYSQCKLECYDYQKIRTFLFKKIHFILFCLFVPKMKKVVIKMSSAIVILSALRVEV